MRGWNLNTRCDCGTPLRRVRVWPFICPCGKRYGEAEVDRLVGSPLPVVQGAPFHAQLPGWLKSRLNICRTKCSRYLADGDRCGIQVEKGRAGHLQYMVDHPCLECTCPAPDPLWGHATVNLPDDPVPKPTSDRLIVVVASGPVAEEQLILTAPRMRAYAKRVGADFRVVTADHAPHWPMANKWRIAPFVRAYDRTLYLDVDVIIAPDAPDIFEAVPAEAVAIYDEWSDVFDNAPGDWVQAEADAICKTQQMPLRRLGWMGNAGIILFPRTAADLYRVPSRPFPRFWCLDQILFAMALDETGFPIHRLDRRWNTGFVAADFWKHLPEAHLIHLNGSRPHKYRMDLLQRMLAGDFSRVDPPPGTQWKPKWNPS